MHRWRNNDSLTKISGEFIQQLCWQKCSGSRHLRGDPQYHFGRLQLAGRCAREYTDRENSRKTLSYLEHAVSLKHFETCTTTRSSQRPRIKKHTCAKYEPHAATQCLALPLPMRKVTNSDLGPDADFPDRFRGIPQFLLENAGTES
jgi:hypothetical protein